MKASKSVPDWWKELPTPTIGNAINVPGKNSNMRKCYGFVEFFKRGLVIQNWTDMHLRTDFEGIKYFTVAGPGPATHPMSQYSGGFPDHWHTKLTSPWFFKEKTGVHFAWIGAEWNLDRYDFKVLPGVLEFKFNTSTNINLMLPVKKEPIDMFLPAGLPLVHVIPLDDSKKLEVQCHLITEQELSKVHHKHITFRGLSHQIKLWKRNHSEDDSKCPFH